MAWTERYANFDLATGLNDGTSEANAWQTVADMAAGMAAGIRCNIKRQANPYAHTGSMDWMNTGTNINPSSVRGYEITPGDGGFWEMNKTGPDVAFIGKDWCISENIKVNAGGGVVFLAGSVHNAGSDNATARRCIVTNAAFIRAQDLIGCYLELGSGSIRIQGVNSAKSICYGNVFRRVGGGSDRFLVESDSFAKSQAFINNLIIGNGVSATEIGLKISRNENAAFTSVVGNVIYNCGVGLEISGNPLNPSNYLLGVYGNVFSEMAGYAIERLSAANPDANAIISDNAYHNCVSGLTNFDQGQVAIDGANYALSASPFTDAANNDFTINTDANGGQILRDVHMPPASESPVGAQIRFFGPFIEPGGGGASTHSYFG